MQQVRSFLRRVCVLKPFINENCPSSRRAYFPIRLADKTSRPHLFEFANVTQFYCIINPLGVIIKNVGSISMTLQNLFSKFTYF